MGGPERAAHIFFELSCLVSVGDDDCTEFADKAVASRGCRARYRARNCTQRATQSDRMTGDIERA